MWYYFGADPIETRVVLRMNRFLCYNQNFTWNLLFEDENYTVQISGGEAELGTETVIMPTLLTAVELLKLFADLT